MIKRGVASAVLGIVLGLGLQDNPAIPAVEMDHIRCAVLAIPQIAAAIKSGRKPLLIVNGKDSGRMARGSKPCRAAERIPAGISEIRFAKPGFAEKVYGKKGREGVVEVQYARPSFRKG